MDNDFPGFSAIYLFTEDPSTTAFRAEVDLSFDDAVNALRGEIDIRIPVSAKWVMGRRKPADIVPANNGISILISEKCARALTAVGCTGWSTFPAELVGRGGELFPEYSGLRISGRCGPMQWERSRQAMREYVGGQTRVYVGHYFDEREWDGSDLFMPSGQNGIMFVTQKAADGLTAAKIKGVMLKRAAVVERNWER